MSYKTLEPAIDPNNRISFLLDWELTLKCNLDCDYCPTGIYGGHDNSTKHPPLAECIKTTEFMYEYANLYMNNKPKGIKYVILNVYGGESLHHPDIESILDACIKNYQPYARNWHLTVTTTTNGIISDKKFDKIIPYIDEFTFSYHSQNTLKQKSQYKRNVLAAKSAGKRVKCVVLKHPKYFDDTVSFIKWCEDNGVKYLARQLDHSPDTPEFNYNEQQIIWFDNMYKSKGSSFKELKPVGGKVDLAATGRACCGGRSICTNGDYKNKKFYIEGNNFTGWKCSVNEFFVYIKQVNGEIFTNKDCKVNFNNEVAPIGHLNDTESLISYTREKLATNSMPVIECIKERCYCGLCAPKAETLEEFNNIIKKYRKK